VTDTLKKEVEKKEQDFKNELNDEKVLKERQEIVNNRLKQELDELKRSEQTSKKVTEDKMKAIEKEFIEKQKITIDLERRKATEKQEKTLAAQ